MHSDCKKIKNIILCENNSSWSVDLIVYDYNIDAPDNVKLLVTGQHTFTFSGHYSRYHAADIEWTV